MTAVMISPATAPLKKKYWRLSVEEAEKRYAHGTRARYNFARCRCESCKSANRDYENARNARNTKLPWRCSHVPARGSNGSHGNAYYVVSERATKRVALRTPDRDIAFAVRDLFNREDGALSERQLVDAADVRAHLVALSAAGIGRDAIAVQSGVSPGVIDRLRRGQIKRTRRVTAAKLLAVDGAAALPGSYVDSAEIWAAVDRMAAAGFELTWLTAVLGLPRHAFGRSMRRSGMGLERSRAILALYAQLAASVPQLRAAAEVQLHGEA